MTSQLECSIFRLTLECFIAFFLLIKCSHGASFKNEKDKWQTIRKHQYIMWQRPVSGKVSLMFVNQNTKNTLSKYLETIFVAQWQIHTAVLSTITIRGMVRFHFCFTNEITKQCYACCFMYRDNFVPHGICFSASGWKCQKVWLLSWLLFRFLLKC